VSFIDPPPHKRKHGVTYPDVLTDQLEVMAAWKSDLKDRIAVAKLRFELVGLSPEIIINLSAEVQEFSRAKDAIKSEFNL
jgi:hypothetical protein